MAKKATIIGLGFFTILLGSAGAGLGWINSNLTPSPLLEPKYINLEGPIGRKAVISRLKKEGVIKNYDAFELYAQWKRTPSQYRGGIFLFKPGMTPDQILANLNSPLSQMVRLPEGRWIKWMGKILEEKGVCKQSDYVAVASQPDKFRKQFTWLPAQAKTLEGFLYPDTYNLPPTLGAERTIMMQLTNFERRMEPEKLTTEQLWRAVTVGSMVELEAQLDVERPVVAGVIANRIKKGMRLEIDATVLYALQEWKVLGPGVVRTVVSPFNTYLNNGLPPGPIGSPGMASMKAALAPKDHPYLFYVAKGDRSGEHIFATTYADHLRNIRVARAMTPKVN